MPYASMKDINPALKGIKPGITLAQANLIAKWADAMEQAEDGPESSWAAAIAQFKKLYQIQGGKWVKRKQKEMEYKAYTMSTSNVLIPVNAVDVDGQAVPVAELVAAYKGQEESSTDLMAIKTHQEEAAEMDVDKLRGLLSEALDILGRQPEKVTEIQLSESASGHAIGLAEADPSVAAGPRAPLLMNVSLIKPGWGNKKDKHYYPREVLERDARVFEGVKMYATDHRPEEKSVRTEVAVIKACPTGFTEKGAPIARVAVHDGDFAEQARNREKLGTLDSLECSILALGRTKKGEVDGEEANIVEAITKGQSVDWVTKAGAGGHALNLAENSGGVTTMSEQEKEKDEKVEETSQEEAQAKEVVLAEQEQAQQEEAPQKLAEAEVEKLVEATNLPGAFKAALKAVGYDGEDAVKAAIAEAEGEYKKATGSGRPFAQGGEPSRDKPLSERDRVIRFNEIMDRVGGRQVPVPAEQ